MKIKENSIIAVDLDQTLCTGDNFTEEDCLNALPILDVIQKVNEMNTKRYCFIVIHTARKEFLRNATTYWLKKHQVRYNTLVMEKLWADYYVDDKAINIPDFMGR